VCFGIAHLTWSINILRLTHNFQDYDVVEFHAIATKAGVKTVILTHLSPHPQGDDDTPWAEQVRKHFSGQVVIAKDLMEF
jgi:ribonuclease BN (tRNA processing enzyme)